MDSRYKKYTCRFLKSSIGHAKLELEPEGQEFGTVCFEELPVADTHSLMVETVEVLQVETPPEIGKEITLPLKRKQMITLQKRDEECRNIMKKLKTDKNMEKIYMNDNGCLVRFWPEEETTYKCTVVPKVLRDPLLMLCHNKNGHNGYRWSYMALK